MEQKRRRGFPQTEKGGVFLFSLEHSSAQKNPGGEPFDPEVPPHLLFRRRQGRKSQLRMVTEGTASPFNAPVITSTAACIEAATAP